MAYRFTLDSATEFLFGKNVHSLSAGLAYPPSSLKSKSTTSLSHSSNTFSEAFGKGQFLIAVRSRFGLHWPLREFWKDQAKEQRAIVDDFIEPILDEAVAKNKPAQQSNDTYKSTTGVKDDETLLDHLVNFTDSEYRRLLFKVTRIIILCDLVDHAVLKDEIVNITVAGRDTASGLLLECSQCSLTSV
jgi:hypothetical protein